MYVCMYVCMYACMDGWMDGWMHACMYVCMYVCMYYIIDTTLPLIHAALRYSNILSSKSIVSKNHTSTQTCTQTCTCVSELPGLPVLSTSEINQVQGSLLALQETNFRV